MENLLAGVCRKGRWLAACQTIPDFFTISCKKNDAWPCGSPRFHFIVVMIAYRDPFVKKKKGQVAHKSACPVCSILRIRLPGFHGQY